MAVTRLIGLLVVVFAVLGTNLLLARASDIVGHQGLHIVQKGETLLDVARANDLGILEVMAANPGLDPWIPAAGKLVLLPLRRILPDAPRQGIVINLAERRLYLFGENANDIQSWPIGIGRMGFTTPLGQTRVVRKALDPVWYPTKEARAEDPELPRKVPAGPDNPLGKHALYLGWPQYAIHGTNRPWGIGRNVSRGCIRLYPENIETLFNLVKVGRQVTVVDQIVKVAWEGRHLYLEIHPNREQLDVLEATGAFAPAAIEGLVAIVEQAAGEQRERLDITAIFRAERERRGIPVLITNP